MYTALQAHGLDGECKPVAEGYELDFALDADGGPIDVECDGLHQPDARAGTAHNGRVLNSDLYSSASPAPVGKGPRRCAQSHPSSASLASSIPKWCATSWTMVTRTSSMSSLSVSLLAHSERPNTVIVSGSTPA